MDVSKDRKEVSTEEFFTTMNRVRKAWLSFTPAVGINKSLFGLMMTTRKLCRERPAVPGAKITELAHLLEHSAAGVSQKINALERQGLVERVSDAADRRNTYIRLTDAGSRLTEEACARFDARIQEMLCRLGEEKSRQLLELLDALALILEDSSAQGEIDAVQLEPENL